MTVWRPRETKICVRRVQERMHADNQKITGKNGIQAALNRGTLKDLEGVNIKEWLNRG